MDQWMAIFFAGMMGIGFVRSLSAWLMRVQISRVLPGDQDQKKILPTALHAFLPRMRRRRRAIERSLPTMLDWLSLLVEAGLDFMGALQRLSQEERLGELGAELCRVVTDVQVGVPRAEALRRFAVRVRLPSVSSFVATLIHADRVGSSIGPLLRAHAERVRAERFRRAERAGAIASQKLLLPLIFCIMPTTFLVIFGPIALHFAEQGIEAFL